MHVAQTLRLYCCHITLCTLQTTPARTRTLARGCGSIVCGRAHEPRYKPHKSHEPRARVAQTVVGTSKGGSQACKGRRYVQLR
jgi:hypothetical protein